MRLLVRVVNILIALLLVIALGAVFWFAWRPLPKTAGAVAAPVAKETRIARDALGVPHIAAGSLDDALFAEGYAMAQDRLFQMDGLRRLAGGELAEILGPGLLDPDRDSRRLRLHRIAEEAARVLNPAERAMLAAYARGVNEFIETHRGNLPLEFSLLRYEPRPWRISDTILVGLQMYRTLTTTWTTELKKEALLAGGDREKVNFLFPVRSGAESQPGSNAWVVSGANATGGKPLLANDPHMEYANPSIWYMVHLQAPGLDVAGVTFPGIPGVVIGHNDRIAWGVTNLGFDVQDLYIEKLDLQTGRYLYQGKLEQASREQEFIGVKGGRPVEQVNWVTRHGPVLVSGDNRLLSLRWAAADVSGYAYPILDLNRARDWTEFKAALARWTWPGQNFVYGDAAGNIGYQATGRLPIRANYDGDVPVDGTSGEHEWQGYIPFEQLPSAFNPPSGRIVTANQNPFPADYPYRVGGNFAPAYRERQIRDLLAARGKFEPADMLAMQKDVYSAFSRFLAKQAVAVSDRRGASDARLKDAVDLLRKWNGQMEKDQAAPLIAELLYQHLRKRLAERASPGKGALYDYQMAPARVERLLRDRPQGWFADYDQVLLEALIDALDEGRRMQGRDPSRWLWGKYLQLAIGQPVGSRLPLVGGFFRLGPVMMSGSGTTVKQTTHILAPSMRLVADPADWDRSLLNILTGESGQILSSHMKDQWQAWYNGTSFPMQFGHVEAKDTLVLRPR